MEGCCQSKNKSDWTHMLEQVNSIVQQPVTNQSLLDGISVAVSTSKFSSKLLQLSYRTSSLLVVALAIHHEVGSTPYIFENVQGLNS